MAAFPLFAPCPDLTLPFEQIVPELEGTGVSGQVVPEIQTGTEPGWSHAGERDQDVTSDCSGRWHGDSLWECPRFCHAPKNHQGISAGSEPSWLSAAAPLSSPRGSPGAATSGMTSRSFPLRAKAQVPAPPPRVGRVMISGGLGPWQTRPCRARLRVSRSRAGESGSSSAAGKLKHEPGKSPNTVE